MRQITRLNTPTRRGLLGLLVGCLFVFQTSALLHDFDVSAHDNSAECEICDLFVSSNDDGDQATETAPVIRIADARPSGGSQSVSLVSHTKHQHTIRAPPLVS